MNQCIKCNKEIPEGELFCVECSLNPSSVTTETISPAERYPIPNGRMQTPKPVKRAPVQAPPPPRETHNQSKKGMVLALVIVSLLLAFSLGSQLLQYSSIQTEKNRLRTKEADLALRQSDMEDLQEQLDGLNLLLDDANAALAEKDEEIEELKSQISSVKSSQSQGKYDLTAKQLELEKLEDENLELNELCDTLEAEIDTLEEAKSTLEAALEAARPYKTKADFMDSYVVFVENNGSGLYHTYDCASFSKSNFWAYSRKLAEAQGFKACPTCGGTP